MEGDTGGAGAVHAPGRGPQLDPARIIATIGRLRDRVAERFPGSGLEKVAGELRGIAGDIVRQLEWAARPNVPLRIAAWGLIALALAGLAAAVATAAARVEVTPGDMAWPDLVQAVEAGVNDLVLLGAGVFFLLTAEGRVKRRRALRYLRQMRALAHIVDMHQLTKDPGSVVHVGTATPSSPRRTLSRFELVRYLDYCSEMLALNSKLAALYAQQFDDPVVLAAVDEVETLTTGLSAKIWQKIMILSQSTSTTSNA
jgi:hypothetical protein